LGNLQQSSTPLDTPRHTGPCFVVNRKILILGSNRIDELQFTVFLVLAMMPSGYLFTSQQDGPWMATYRAYDMGGFKPLSKFNPIFALFWSTVNEFHDQGDAKWIVIRGPSR
jgi:hypothetical protein